MKNSLLFLFTLIIAVSLSSCSSDGDETSESSEGDAKVKYLELSDAELLQHIGKRIQAGWVKKGYEKGNYYIISFGLDYEDNSKPAWMDVIDSSQPVKKRYDYFIQDGKVIATNQKDQSELTLEISAIDKENIIINGEEYVHLTHEEGSRIKSK